MVENFFLSDFMILPSGPSLCFKARLSSLMCKCIWRQRGRVVSALDSQSGGPGFESRSGVSHPEFKSSATLVNSQLVASYQLRFLILLCCIELVVSKYLNGVPVN